MLMSNRLAPLFVTLAVAFASQTPASESKSPILNTEEAAIAGYVDELQGEQLSDLETLVNINSGTMNHQGVREVGKFFANELEKIGFTSWWEDMPPEMNRAGHLFAQRKGGQGKSLLLIGHLDTVFPKDSPFRRFENHGEYAIGPGVDDMKDGDLVILYALKAMFDAGTLDNTSITVVMTGDEENAGSPNNISRASLIKAAQQSDVILSFESGVDGTATLGRRGASGWKVTVEGKRAHSAGIFSEETGAGAIYEMARIINAFNTELAGDPSLTLSPALSLAGTDVTHEPDASSGTVFGKINVVHKLLWPLGT